MNVDKQAQISVYDLQLLRRELLATRELLDAGYAAAEHIGIAGSYDNLKEGQRYIVAWLQKVNEFRNRN